MRALALAVALLGIAAGIPAVASAAPPSLLVEIGSRGPAAGEMVTPQGVATEAGGHVFVADRVNSRVDEFTPWGTFVKAFGWDVAPGAVDEEQELRVRATAGQFKLSFEAATTADLPFNASAEEVEAALNGLASIGAGGVTVEGGPGGIAGTTPSVYVIRFDGAPLDESNVGQITAANGTTPLSGGSPTALEVFTRADGTAGGTGLEACTTASGCKAGTQGAGAGQLRRPGGIAVDDERNIYTFERDNLRVQKFDPAGRFLWMVGGEVNKTTGADICTAADIQGGDTCGEGVEGTGQREFSFEVGAGFYGTLTDYIALSPAGNLYVADNDRIQAIDPAGAFVSQFEFAPAIGGGDPGSLAVDPLSGDLYFAFRQGGPPGEKTPGVFRLSPTGTLLDTLAVASPEALATNPAGQVYAVEVPADEVGNLKPARVVAFDADGDVLISYEENFAQAPAGAVQQGLATNSVGDVLVSVASSTIAQVDVYGPAPVELEPPERVAPEINDQYASSVGTETAALRSVINPRFWPDTRFYVEYGTGDCDVVACTKAPVPPGDLLTSEVVDADLKSPPISLTGLTPATTYNYRFVAESSGGGPTVGEEGTGAEETFTTRRLPTTEPCPGNEAFRNATSPLLPDCRAFEMVSPIDKDGGNIAPLCENLCYSAGLNQSSLTGSGITYSTYKSFDGAESAPYISQYLSRRGATSWSIKAITPPQKGPSPIGLTQDLDSLYQAFTPELESGWVIQTREPVLAAGAANPNYYRRDLAGGSYQALSPEAFGDMPEFQGATADGDCVIFRVNGKLTGNAKEGLVQLYQSCLGIAGPELTLLSILPNGSASSLASSAGTPDSEGNGRGASVFNAISDDGTRVFWSQASSGAGPLYVRIDGAVTKLISAASATFWGASSSGDKVIYEEGSTLKEASISETGTVTATTIAAEGQGVMGISEDAARVYFVSKADLDGGGGAVAGKPNLYLRDAGGNSFIATLADADVSANTKLNPVAMQPSRRTAHVNPSGSDLAFMSLAPLTGYDNTDQVSGKADAQVFLYDAESADLICASCNPTNARPVGKELLVGIEGSQPANIWASGRILTAQTQVYSSRVLADDGTRLYFESTDQLVSSDENEKQDVYQWEELGAGGCSEGDGTFQPTSGGCLDLISSGTSTVDSSFLDASATGNDVFFATDTSLIKADPGLIDVYDARVGGGLPEPPAPPPICKGEACQPVVVPPAAPNPPSQNPGEGNVKPKKCPKGKHLVTKKGKETCVKNKKKKNNKGKKKGSKRQSGRAGR